jgi:glutathione synthase/RimK-type ligase-like ATP-grasp enzyme
LIAVQRKARRLSVPDSQVNWQVRNLAGGFVFTREGFTLPTACETAAHLVVKACGLDFGAVDVIWNETQQKAYVLEINTAPGLEGQTVDDYVTFFKEFV